MAKQPQPVCEELPPLPPVSIDVGAMSAALAAGKTADEAIAAATAPPAAPAPIESEAPASAPEPSTEPTE